MTGSPASALVVSSPRHLGLPPHGETAAVPVDDLVNNDLTIRASFGYTSAAWRRW